MKVFLSGPPGVGKSTIIQNTVTALRKEGYRIGGISTPEMRRRGSRAGFEIVDLLSGKRGTLSQTGGSSGPSVGRFRVNLESLTTIGVAALDSAVAEADVIVLDEVGPMELQGKDFQEAILRAVDSPKPILGVIHWRSTHPIAEKIRRRSDVKIVEVSLSNRGRIQQNLIEELLTTLKETKH